VADFGGHSRLLEEGFVVNGRYRVVRQLRSGGMAVVYEVLQMATQRRRALKLLRPSLSPDLAQRFQREATIASSIVSQHIVEVLDAGTDPETGLAFLVMELLRGEDLASMLARRGPLPPREVVGYLWHAAQALDKAHAANIVHRDLKPANLFVTRADDGTPLVKLLDFGIAKLLSDAAAVESRGVVGTPLYLAPEQAHGEQPLSARTDVHAIGQLAYVLSVGEAYWAAEQEATDNVMQLLLKVAAGPVQAPVERARARSTVELPPAFDAWFARATAPDPSLRYGSVSEAVRALAQIHEIDPGSCLSQVRYSVPQKALPATDEGGGASTRSAVSRPQGPEPRMRRLAWLVVALAAAAIALFAWRANGPTPSTDAPVQEDARPTDPEATAASAATPATAAPATSVAPKTLPPPPRVTAPSSAAAESSTPRTWEPPVEER
jgi:serine/threonine-protein kinase